MRKSRFGVVPMCTFEYTTPEPERTRLGGPPTRQSLAEAGLPRNGSGLGTHWFIADMFGFERAEVTV
jgi:hypothetical protein